LLVCEYEILNYKNENVKKNSRLTERTIPNRRQEYIRTACYPVGTRVRSRLTGHFTASTLYIIMYINPSKCWKLIKCTLVSKLYLCVCLCYDDHLFRFVCLLELYFKKCKKKNSDEFSRLVIILNFWITFREAYNR